MPNLREPKKAKTDSNGSGLRGRALRSWRWLWTETVNTDSVGAVTRPSALTPPNDADSSKSELSGVFSHLLPLKIIAWLGASAGGLTILLVVLGFLALSAHDAMLGIPRSIQSNPEYVAIGGLFFGRSVIFLVASFISLKSWIVLGILLIGGFILFKIPRRSCRGRSLVIILLGVALLTAEVYGLARLIRPLQISNLLLNVSVDANSPGKQVVDAILVKDTPWLGVEYGFLVLLVLAFSLAFILFEQRADRVVFWQLTRIPAFTLLIICVFLLPRVYGVLTISNDYPEVSLESSSPSGGQPVNETHLLLREDEKVFVLYEPSSQSIVTIKRESISRHRMYAPQHVFTASVGKK